MAFGEQPKGSELVRIPTVTRLSANRRQPFNTETNSLKKGAESRGPGEASGWN
jgi:hypothetical protein